MASGKEKSLEKVARFIDVYCKDGNMKLVLPCFSDACRNEDEFNHGPLLFALDGDKVGQVAEIPDDLVATEDGKAELVAFILKKYVHCMGLEKKISIDLKK